VLSLTGAEVAASEKSCRSVKIPRSQTSTVSVALNVRESGISLGGFALAVPDIPTGTAIALMTISNDIRIASADRPWLMRETHTKVINIFLYDLGYEFFI
jgi:hypothetical protein